MFLLCKKLLNVKEKKKGTSKTSMRLWPKGKKSFTCFDTVYGEGIFEKVKLHAEYT